jgi:hypothetical protein
MLPTRHVVTEVGVADVGAHRIPVLQSSRTRSRATSKELETLDQRRSLYDYFIELYRQNKNRNLSEVEIAVAARYRDRSAVAKYLNGTASERCAQRIEKVLNMMPDEFDQR